MDLANRASALLTDLLGPLGPLIALGGFGALLIFVTLPLMLLLRREDPLKKLQRTTREAAPRRPQKESLRQNGRIEQLQRFAGFLEPKNEKELSAIQLKLRQAGYQSRDSVRLFHFSQFALGIVGLGLGLLYAFGLSEAAGHDMQMRLLYVVFLAGAGYFLPRYWITRRIATRKDQIIRGFPDALDMLLVCIEAGQSLDQAIVRVAAELRSACPALAEEFEIVAYEMKAGKDKATVLRDMGARCGVADISSFVTVLIQSASFGTSIADALRVYAAEMRDKRVMRAEEAANKLPTKMTLATMMLTVPPLLIILVGPSANSIANLGNMGN